MLSKVKSVISDWLGEQFRACSSRSRKRWVAIKPAVRARGGDFFRYTDAEKLLLLDRLPGRVMFGRLQSIRRWAGNLLSLCSDPIPPVAVATAQPAKRVLSRSAGGKRLSSITLCNRNWLIQHLSDRVWAQVDTLISPILSIFQNVAANEPHV